MSNNATPERSIPHGTAYPIEARRAHTIRFIEFMASMNALDRIRPAHIATTYGGFSEAQVEAEMVKHMPEDSAK
jgi:hypothetical protein